MRAPIAVFSHRSLLWQFVKRDVLARYRGSMLGLAWAVLTPLLMLGVYTFVFREVFKVRWQGGTQLGGLDFALQLYAGLIVFSFMAECINRAPRLVVDQATLVKKVVFPLEILAWIPPLSAFFQLLIGAAVLCFAAALAGSLAPTVLLLPLVWLPLLPLALAAGWFLAALGVFVRDIGQIVGLAVNLLMFLSPVFYPMEVFPDRWRGWLYLNPLTILIEETRNVVLLGRLPDPLPFSVLLVTALGLAGLAGLWFRALRKGFADVL